MSPIELSAGQLKKLRRNNMIVDLPLVSVILHTGEVVPTSALKPPWLARSLENFLVSNICGLKMLY